jgi:hypothetical protein
MRDMSLAAMTETSKERASAELKDPRKARGDSMVTAMATAIELEERVGFFLMMGSLAAALLLGADSVALPEPNNSPQSVAAGR